METDTLVIIYFYSATYLFICLILFIQELDSQYKRLLRYGYI